MAANTDAGPPTEIIARHYGGRALLPTATPGPKKIT
jgi:hypothetical protein